MGIQSNQLDMWRDWSTGALGRTFQQVVDLVTLNNVAVLMLQEPRPCRERTGYRRWELSFLRIVPCVLGPQLGRPMLGQPFPQPPCEAAPCPALMHPARSTAGVWRARHQASEAFVISKLHAANLLPANYSVKANQA